MATMTTTRPDTTRLPWAGGAHRHPLGLGLTPAELDVALLAVGDREDLATVDERAVLGRVRAALERELARILAE